MTTPTLPLSVPGPLVVPTLAVSAGWHQALRAANRVALAKLAALPHLTLVVFLTPEQTFLAYTLIPDDARRGLVHGPNGNALLLLTDGRSPDFSLPVVQADSAPTTIEAALMADTPQVPDPYWLPSPLAQLVIDAPAAHVTAALAGAGSGTLTLAGDDETRPGVVSPLAARVTVTTLHGDVRAVLASGPGTSTAEVRELVAAVADRPLAVLRDGGGNVLGTLPLH